MQDVVAWYKENVCVGDAVLPSNVNIGKGRVVSNTGMGHWCVLML